MHVYDITIVTSDKVEIDMYAVNMRQILFSKRINGVMRFHCALAGTSIIWSDIVPTFIMYKSNNSLCAY